MALTPRQQETLANLKKYQGFETPEQVIEWCRLHLNMPWRVKGKPRTNHRDHSKRYFQEIINFLT